MAEDTPGMEGPEPAGAPAGRASDEIVEPGPVEGAPLSSIPADAASGEAGGEEAGASRSGGEAGDDAASDAVESDIDDLAKLAAERDEYLDALRRLQADFENFKKRVMKQQTENLERAAEDLVNRLLPVLDAGDLAIAHGGGDAVEQVAGMLFDTLAKEGLEGIAPDAGAQFDPTEHDAVAHEDGDGAPEVVEVLRAGYRWKGKLLRAAMVRVKGS